MRIKPKFGVYWDKELNPYCPSCKSLLCINEDLVIYCLCCNREMPLVSDKLITLKEARKLLRN